MNQILRCDWLSERARWSYLALAGLPAVSRKKNFPEIHIINPLLTKLVRSRWLEIGLVLFFFFVSVHKLAKKNLANIETTNGRCILGTSFVGIAIGELNLSRLQAGFARFAAEFIQFTFSFQADRFIQPSVNCT